jgi:hypothetical protein
MVFMGKRKKPQQEHPKSPNLEVKESSDDARTQATEKYRELYSYSTDVLLKEHERFNRADEKAANLTTMFVFLIGIVAYFDKWVLDELKWHEFPIALPSDLSLCMAGVVGLLALMASAAGLLLANHAAKLRPIVSRPLNHEILGFFEKQTLITIYYGMAREMVEAYSKNRPATDKKYTLLIWSYRSMGLALLLLAELLVMYCLYSWC